ncbi:hypothetical protein SNEBB_008933, partial [Seison nebaliae]
MQDKEVLSRCPLCNQTKTVRNHHRGSRNVIRRTANNRPNRQLSIVNSVTRENNRKIQSKLAVYNMFCQIEEVSKMFLALVLWLTILVVMVPNDILILTTSIIFLSSFFLNMGKKAVQIVKRLIRPDFIELSSKLITMMFTNGINESTVESTTLTPTLSMPNTNKSNRGRRSSAVNRCYNAYLKAPPPQSHHFSGENESDRSSNLSITMSTETDSFVSRTNSSISNTDSTISKTERINMLPSTMEYSSSLSSFSTLSLGRRNINENNQMLKTVRSKFDHRLTSNNRRRIPVIHKNFRRRTGNRIREVRASKMISRYRYP